MEKNNQAYQSKLDEEKHSYKFEEIFQEEKKFILQRRDNLRNMTNNLHISEDHVAIDKNTGKITIDNLFGLALSGGGIRSSTLNMGFLNSLNDKGILKFADYISSVSGGGFIHSYIQTRLKESGNFLRLFQNSEDNSNNNKNKEYIKGDNKILRENCDYLIPSQNKLIKFANSMRVYGAIVSSFLMNLFWLIIFILLLLLLAYVCVSYFVPNLKSDYKTIMQFLGMSFAVVAAYHYFLFVLRHKYIFKYIPLWSSNILNYVEGFLILFIAAISIFYWIDISHEELLKLLEFTKITHDSTRIIIILSSFILAGYFANPNILSLHRYYGDRIANAFIIPFINKKESQIKLHEIIKDDSINPYPLINTCMNITEWKRKNKNATVNRDKKNWENIYGLETSDYFLLSPEFCGSSLTGYVPTKDEYNDLTLSTAVASSGSALNTMMGNKTNRFIALFIYLFNAVLGYWIKNPGWRGIQPFKFFQHMLKDSLIKYLTFWPYYLWKAMQGKADHSRGRVNISDGGHIENLGIIELLRRRCKLIIAVDASADPGYGFSDLTNLVVRAREKLGLKITFEKKPEDIIRPCPSTGYSEEHYVKAVVTCLPGAKDCDKEYKGILIYVKSSLKAPQKWEDEGNSDSQDEANAFNYKINHPSFPHDTTINQFFDPDQWNAYYFLGRFIADDIFQEDAWKVNDLDSLIEYFDKKSIPSFV